MSWKSHDLNNNNNNKEKKNRKKIVAVLITINFSSIVKHNNKILSAYFIYFIIWNINRT